MNRTYLIVPIVGIAAFIGYSAYWKTHAPANPAVVTKALDPYADRNGRKEAEAEFAAGKLVLIEASTPVSWDKERREIAQQKFDLELRRAPEPSTEASAKYVDTFNRFMRPRIIARHGRSVFDTIHQEAIALNETRQPQSAAKASPAPEQVPAATAKKTSR